MKKTPQDDNTTTAVTTDEPRCGHVAIVGRPNVGKSTLMNRLLGQKLSITSHKPQTTRNIILGVKTTGDCQMVFVDTPGIHRGEARAINRYMNRVARSSMHNVDVIVLLVDALHWTDEDDYVLRMLQGAEAPVLLAVNKVDTVKEKARLLPFIEKIKDKLTFVDIVPLSALDGHNVEQLEALLAKFLPVSAHLFAQDQLTDRSERFLAAEIIREKVMRFMNKEIPYEVAVEIEQFKEETSGMLRVHALILVERDGQKAIIIGAQGEMLKKLGTLARQDMERLFGAKVMLKLWVKVKAGWSDDARALRSLGYDEI